MMVQKPDIAGMIKQDDAFVTLESGTIEQELCVKIPKITSIKQQSSA